MRAVNALKMMTCAAALLALLAPNAHADEWNKKTFLTFSGPVQIPGTTLAAGTYTFELADPDNARHVIRVSSQDGKKVLGLFMTIPQDRLDPPDDNLIMFAERPAGSPQAIQAWFYPGDRIGEEFVYPKSQAMKIAKATHKTVLATEDTSASNTSDADRMSAMKGAKVGRVDENGRLSDTDTHPTTTARANTTPAASANKPQTTTTPQATTAPRTATAAPANTVDGSRRSRPTTARSNTAQSTTAPATAGTTGQTNTARSNRRSLPQTGSNLPLFGLLSLASLVAAGAVRTLRHHSAAAR